MTGQVKTPEEEAPQCGHQQVVCGCVAGRLRLAVRRRRWPRPRPDCSRWQEGMSIEYPRRCHSWLPHASHVASPCRPALSLLCLDAQVHKARLRRFSRSELARAANSLKRQRPSDWEVAAGQGAWDVCNALGMSLRELRSLNKGARGWGGGVAGRTCRVLKAASSSPYPFHSSRHVPGRGLRLELVAPAPTCARDSSSTRIILVSTSTCSF